MKNKLAILMIGSLPFACFHNTFAANYNDHGLSLSASLGTLSGKANEYVYYEGTNEKLSQLDWRINNAAILNGELNYDFMNRMSINGRGWITIANNKAAMDDYDWLNPNQAHWTHWSHHDNTLLTSANELDLSLRSWGVQKQNYKLGLALGYQRNFFQWLSKGGCYEYNNGAHVGCFPSDMLGIGYQQKWSTVYLGLAGKYSINRFEFNALLKWGPKIFAHDVDEHYARNITFKESGNNNLGYYAALLNAGYFITDNTKIFVEGAYNYYSNTRANTVMIENETGLRTRFNDSAGLSNKNYTIALGIRYRF